MHGRIRKEVRKEEGRKKREEGKKEGGGEKEEKGRKEGRGRKCGFISVCLFQCKN